MVIEMYTWFPFQEYQQCGECRDLVLIDRWNSKGNGQFEKNADLFPHKIPKQFNGCSIKYVLIINSSTSWELEWFLLRKVFDSINVTELVQTRNANNDIIVSRYFGDVSILNSVDRGESISLPNYKKSFPHMFSTLRFYVPCPRKTVRHGNFYKVFAPGVWLLFFITCILMAVITIFLQRAKKSEYFNNLTYSLYCTWAVVTSVSVPQMPTTNKLRIFFFMWVCYCLTMSTVFQSFFTSFLIEPGTEEQINTIEELLNHDLELFADDEIFFRVFFFSEFGTRFMNAFGNQSGKYNSTIGEFFTHERSAIIASDLDMKLKFPRDLTWIEPCYFYFCDDFSRYLFIFNPRSPYYEAFNSKVLQFHEAGLFIKEIEDYISSVSKKSVLNVTVLESKFGKQTTEEYFIFNLKHMKVAFIIYLCGNIFSVVVFIAEVVFGKK
ncbi:hypothetical protein L9F63_016693 [Diploptera punctata]|uniref:Ionotropic glutamate receptor C-terminal domain-containing protein n=1 Tax=Diploptera punctata TaxID=6984 RepID=A0AAD8EHK4_DIPPU|nr:hypothetical protein L9F63_016693 [Diploptera punctata]